VWLNLYPHTRTHTLSLSPQASGGEAAAPAKKNVVKYGLKHVTQLIEDKKVR
jgi:hypothetical protein